MAKIMEVLKAFLDVLYHKAMGDILVTYKSGSVFVSVWATAVFTDEGEIVIDCVDGSIVNITGGRFTITGG